MAWSKFLIKKVYAETDVVFLPDEKSFIGEKEESCFKIVDWDYTILGLFIRNRS